MSETRFKDIDWVLGSTACWERATVALLMDCRDELKKLNRLMGCENFVAIPRILRDIKRNTTKPRRKRK